MIEELGRYDILEEIGQGGFAIVYRGRDTELDRLVALKELRPILLQDTDWVKRFRREARTIARLDHPHIVTIYDIFEPQERLFIVMRLVEGPSLEELITNRGRLPWSEAVEIITSVTEGLDYAHTQGILHRDLKPANILMDLQRGPMLSDFGLAKLTGESSMSMTATGSVVGTPHYIAPEVWENKGTSPQSDIYALGCILYEMLTGEKVFKGETPPAVMMAHFRPLVLPEVWPAGIPPGVANVLTTALANKPDDRYATAGEMAEALGVLAVDKPAEPDHIPEEKVPDVTLKQPETVALDSEIDDIQPADAGVIELEQPGLETEIETKHKPVIPSSPAPGSEAPDLTPQVQQQMEPSAPSPPPTSPPVAPASVPWAARRIGRKRRFGCLWISLPVGLVVVLLIIVGAWGLCATVDSIFNRTVEVGSTITEKISVVLPDSSDTISLDITLWAGELFLAPGAENRLVEGTVIYNVAELKPKVIDQGSQVTLKSEGDIGFDAFRNDIENRWDLKLAPVPMELNIEAFGVTGDIELGGLTLTNLTVGQGGANFELSFSELNQTEMDTLHFTGGASSATLAGLANARADEIIFQGGAGSYTLDFSGELQDDVDVKIEAGLGTVTIIVPEDVAARVSLAGQMASVSAKGAWQKSGEDYILPGEGHTIIVKAEMGPGNLELRNP